MSVKLARAAFASDVADILACLVPTSVEARN